MDEIRKEKGSFLREGLEGDLIGGLGDESLEAGLIGAFKRALKRLWIEKGFFKALLKNREMDGRPLRLKKTGFG